jgi:spermidine synthase
MTPYALTFLVIYLLSGAAALLYEVLWLRLLTLSMGHTAAATGIVLAAFMGGLAAGAWASGRVADTLAPARALRVYAAFEALIAGCALAMPSALALVQPLLAGAYADGDGARVFHLALGAAALVLLGLPAAAMGATYPVAVRWWAGRGDAASGAARLYAANTIGATAGAALAGFVLLPQLGMRSTTLVGVALNIVAALGALWLAGRTAPPYATRRPEAPPYDARGPAGHDLAQFSPVGRALAARHNRSVAALAAGASGLVALASQVMWTRVLALVLGPTTYAFSAMLVAFISGMAIGSTLAIRIARRSRAPAAWLGGSMVAGAAASLLATLAVDRLPLLIAPVAARPDATFESMFGLQLGLVAVLLLPMTIAFGAAFPFALALASPDTERASRAVAVVYAVNTAGAIAGALGGSLALLPALGIQWSIRLAAVVAAVAGGLVWRRVALPALVVAMAVAVPGWNEERLANGGYRFSSALAAGDIASGLEAGRLVYYREGAAGTVSVRELPGVRALAIDGKVDASNGGDMLTQKLLAHLPLLLHPAPRTVCIIGLGSGVTAGAALRHPIARADIVEISAEVVEASRLFARENGDALADPRSRLVPGDGRSHLLMSGERYDVIISEPSNPWMAGVAALFTREFFAAARARLAPGGILTQWAHTYSIADEDLRSIVATFLDVFPDGSAWLVGEADLLLVGSTAPLGALDEGIAPAWRVPGVADDLALVAVRDPFSLLTLFVARGDDLARYAAGARVQDDDRMALEFSAPRALYGTYQQDNVQRLQALREASAPPPAVTAVRAAAPPAAWRDRARMQLEADAPALAYEDFRAALAMDPRDGGALTGLVQAAARSGRLGGAEALLRDVTMTGAHPAALVQLSVVLSMQGRLDDATNVARSAVLAAPGDAEALEQLASMYAERGDADALTRLASVVDQLAPARGLVLYTRARLAFVRQEYEQAARLAGELAALEPDNAVALSLAGSARAALGDHDGARQAFEGSLQRSPRDPVVLTNLGTIQLRLGNLQAAREHFEDALFLAPTLAAARQALADLRGRRAGR